MKMHAGDPDQSLLVTALSAAAEAFLTALDAGGARRAIEFTTPVGDSGRTAFDPLLDPAPLPLDPRPGATPAEQHMAYVTFLGAIARINAEEGRGANSNEVSKFARKAGYSGGNAVNGWNSRPGSERAIENVNGERYLNESGHAWIRELAHELGISLKGDMTPLTVPISASSN